MISGSISKSEVKNMQHNPNLENPVFTLDVVFSTQRIVVLMIFSSIKNG
jgi:hypothetical protein